MVPHTAMGRFRLAIPALSRGSSFSLDPADAAGKIFGSASASARVFIGLVAAAKGEKILGNASALAQFIMGFVLPLHLPWSASESAFLPVSLT